MPFPSDEAILSYIDSMPEEEFERFDFYQPTDMRHYAMTQRPWLETELYYYAMELGRPPTEEEAAARVFHSRTPRRFRAYYALRYSEKTLLRDHSRRAAAAGF